MNKFLEFYLRPFILTNPYSTGFLEKSKFRNILIISVYLLISFFSSYSIFQNPYFLNEIISENEERILAESSVEYQSMIENTNRILQNPAYHIILSMYIVWDILKSFIFFSLFLFLLLSLMTDKWNLRKNFLEVLILNINILTMGILLNTLFKHIFLKADLIIALSLLFKTFPHNLAFIMRSIDLFSVLFLYSLSYHISKLYSEKIYVALSLVFSLWLCLLFISQYIGINFFFIV